MSKFSFIIPVYNCGIYIKSCIESIKKINIENYEIILVDDGSTDDSAVICDELERETKEIFCMHQKNQGVSEARNQGIKLATGDYIIFIDADDSIVPDKFNKLLKIVENDTSIDMAIFGMSFDYYHRGKCYRRDNFSASVVGKIQSKEWIQQLPELYSANALSPIWNRVIKSSILKNNNLQLKRDMFLYEDLEFSLRLMSFCDNIYFSPEIIYCYRQAEDEGNAGRRLKKIERIPILVNQIEIALDELICKHGTDTQRKDVKSILLQLYLILANEKISVSNSNEISGVCDDFAAWFDIQKPPVSSAQQNLVNKMLNRDVCSLILKRQYIATRHKIAVWFKNMKFYQKKNGTIMGD